MAFDSKGLDDYIDVAQRIVEFRNKHPEGSLQPASPAQPFEIRELAGSDKNGKEVRQTFIIYTAAAYRTPEDPRPGIGCAYEVFPGRTPYTLGSELQNAETAAWGRAIVAVLAADTKAGVSSQQEVRNRRAERDSASDAFEQAAPARPQQQPQRPQVVRTATAESDANWLDLTGKEIDKIRTREDGAKVWASIAAAFKDGTCSADDRKALEAMTAAKISAIKSQEDAA